MNAGWRLVCALCLAAMMTHVATAQDASSQDPAVGAQPAAWPLAVRLSSYGKYQDAAWAHLRETGVKYVFLSVPAADEVDRVGAQLRANGLQALVLRGGADLSREDFAEQLAPQLDICERMGVKYMFLSAKRGSASKETAYARLRAAGDIAARHGVTIAIETHPDLGTNGDVQLETMRGVNHPNVRVNIDTANITYYNQNTDAPAEMQKSMAYVATIEFKDHSGGYETWDFPVLGRGVVDFPAIVQLMREHGYAGPVTIEFEGTEGVELDQAATLDAIAASVRYVRALGGFD